MHQASIVMNLKKKKKHMKHLRAHNGADRGPGDIQGTQMFGFGIPWNWHAEVKLGSLTNDWKIKTAGAQL